MLYQKGEIIAQGKTYIILETNNKGYIVNVADPTKYQINKRSKIFIYIHKTEHMTSYYGFKNFKSRRLFTDLTSITGIGPKTAMQVLKQGTENVINYIAQANHDQLAAIPWVGSRTASQIIFELKGKYVDKLPHKEQVAIGEIKQALQTLGFNSKQIKFALTKIDISKQIEDVVEDAIKVIASV